VDQPDGVVISSGIVLPEWIDINGHMNVAYYLLAFDLGIDNFWARLGITDEYIETSKCSTFAVESHVTYQRELKHDDAFLITTQILAYDGKRIHLFQRMYHDEEKCLAATAEWMALHIDLTSRRVTPFPTAVMNALQEFADEQGVLPKPEQAGRRMNVREPIFVSMEQ